MKNNKLLAAIAIVSAVFIWGCQKDDFKEIVVPEIPLGATVLIHGHTDIIGNETYNQKLSLARANEVQGILKAALSKAGRSDVTFEVKGWGEDENVSPFENFFPEERSYNRAVVIDIIPRR